MIKRNQKFFNLLNILSDGILILSSYFLSAWLWLDLYKGTPGNMAAIRSWKHEMGIAAVLYTLVLLFLLALLGLYNSNRIRRLRRNVLVIFEANAVGILAVGMILFLLRLQDFSRGVLVVFFLSSSFLLSFKSVAARLVLTRARERGLNHKLVIVVGTGALAGKYTQSIRMEQPPGFTILGYFGTNRDAFHEQYLGGVEMIEPFVSRFQVDEIIVALEPEELGLLKPVIALCEKTGAKVAIIPFYNDLLPSSPSMEIVGDTKLIYLRSTPLDNLGYAFLKRAADLLFGAALCLLLLPVMAIAAVGIKLTSPGPVLFKQERVGRGKRLFWMYKFRSMQVNAGQDTAWTTNADARRTAFGRVLRKFSIDELPQLFNVLKGEMSLIGPRPEIPFYVEKFAKDIPLYMVKHQIRPGMTGWAQINGYRGDTSIEKRIEHDIWYIENWSLGLDFRILLRTVFGAWINPEQLAGRRKDKKTP